VSDATPVRESEVRRGRDLSAVTVVCDGSHARVEVRGELDIVSAALLEAVLDAHLDRGRRFVTVDLAGLDFVDAAGVGVLVRYHQRYRDAQGRLVFTRLTDRVARLFDLIGVSPFLLVLRTPQLGEDHAVAT
jgi:anti-sigma B factor antagonist